MNYTEAKSLGNKIRRLIRTKDGYEILDRYGMGLWDEGGCWGLARAIKKNFGGNLLAIVNPFLAPPHNKEAQHAVVEIDGYFFDGNGVHKKHDLFSDWEEILKSEIILVPLIETDDREIRCSKAAAVEIYNLIERLKH